MALKKNNSMSPRYKRCELPLLPTPVLNGILVDHQDLSDIKAEILDEKGPDQKGVVKEKVKVADDGDQEKDRKDLNPGLEDLQIIDLENSCMTEKSLLKRTIYTLSAKNAIIGLQLENLFLHISLET